VPRLATSFNRRNLPLHVKLDLALEDEELEAQEAEQRKLSNLKQFSKNVTDSKPVYTRQEIFENGRALEKIAKRADCGHVTAFQYKKIKEAKLEKRVAD
jgi:hypothetical protein